MASIVSSIYIKDESSQFLEPYTCPRMGQELLLRLRNEKTELDENGTKEFWLGLLTLQLDARQQELHRTTLVTCWTRTWFWRVLVEVKEHAQKRVFSSCWSRFRMPTTGTSPWGPAYLCAQSSRTSQQQQHMWSWEVDSAVLLPFSRLCPCEQQDWLIWLLHYSHFTHQEEHQNIWSTSFWWRRSSPSSLKITSLEKQKNLAVRWNS